MTTRKKKIKPLKAWAVALRGYLDFDFKVRAKNYALFLQDIHSSKDLAIEGARLYSKTERKIIPVLITPIKRKKKRTKHELTEKCWCKPKVKSYKKKLD